MSKDGWSNDLQKCHLSQETTVLIKIFPTSSETYFLVRNSRHSFAPAPDLSTEEVDEVMFVVRGLVECV